MVTISNLTRDSLSARLLLSAIALSLLVLVASGVLLSTLNRQALQQAFDERLKLYLKALVADVAALSDGTPIEPGNWGEPQFRTPLSGWYWQIVKLDKEKETSGVLRTSPSLFSQRLPLLDVPNVPRSDFREGYLTGPEGRTLRLLEQEIDLGDENRYLISVAADSSTVADERRRFDLTLAATLAALGVALAASTIIQVRYGLRPLRHLGRALAHVRAGRAERIEGQFPQEIAPLAGELNQVLDTNREIVNRARNHVGNLAHALKTPLSVLINEAADEPSPFAGKVREQLAIMRDQVQFYLDRARAATRAATIGTSTEVEPVVQAFTRTFAKIYRERAIAFDGHVEAGLRFRGERQDLEDILGNLIDNAGKWANSKASISVTSLIAEVPERPLILIVVDDDGPGLPAAQRKSAMERGERLDETKPGSGLGLSIVIDLAKIYGGALTLDDSPLGGLQAQVKLPRA